MSYLRLNNTIFNLKKLKIKKIIVNRNEYYFIGNFFNFLIEDNLYKISDFKNLIKKFSFETLISNSIGKFFVIRKKLSNIEILTSTSFSGLFFVKKGTNYFFTASENEILKKKNKVSLSKDYLSFFINSHRQIAYSPFIGIDSEIKRLPSGMRLTINPSLRKLDFYTNKNEYFYKNNFQNYDKILNLIFLSYKKNVKKKITILFSGGMDSCVLISKAIYNKLNFQGLYINSAMKMNICELMVKYLSKKYSFKNKIIKKNDKKLNFDFLKKNNKFKFHYNLIQSINEISNPNHIQKNQVYLSGQNADTLYYIDTFAPNTYQIFINRFLQIVKSLHLRLFYSSFFLKLITNDFLFKILFVNKNNFYKKRILRLISSGDEHVSYLKTSNNINDKLINFREKTFLKPLLKILKIKNFYQLDSNKLFDLLTKIKWLRFVVNTHISFYENGRYNNSEFLTIYSEGPLVNFFGTNKIGIKEIFFIKPYQQKIIKKYFNFNFLIKQIKLRLNVKFSTKYKKLEVEKNYLTENTDILNKLTMKYINHYRFLDISLRNLNKKLSNTQKIRILNLIIFLKNLKKKINLS